MTEKFLNEVEQQSVHEGSNFEEELDQFLTKFLQSQQGLKILKNNEWIDNKLFIWLRKDSQNYSKSLQK